MHGTSWLTIATADPARVATELRPLEIARTEWLMTIAPADQVAHPVPPPYTLNSLGWTTVTPLLVARTES
ncbi:hypothetical protein ACWF0M_30780 [Kribbella sp. NPDC055110]